MIKNPNENFPDLKKNKNNPSSSANQVFPKAKIIEEKGGKDISFTSIIDRLKRLRNSAPGLNNGESDNYSEVNFVSSDYVIPPSKEIFKRIIILIVILFVCAILVFLGYAAITIKEKNLLSQISEMEKEKEGLEAKIAEMKDAEERLLKLKSHINEVKNLVNNHIYWEKLFEALEKFTLSDVHYNTFDFDISGQLKLTAMAKNFDVLSEQLIVFNSNPEFFNSAEISSMNLEQDKDTGQIKGVSFSVVVNVNPNIFYNRIEEK